MESPRLHATPESSIPDALPPLELQVPPALRDLRDRRLAFVDVETTGFDPSRHELLEIGVVLVDLELRNVIREEQVRVRPERLDLADPAALSVCGFDERVWIHAAPLADALGMVAPLLEGAIVAGHNVDFDWGFLAPAFEQVRQPLPPVDYHRLDTASLAWPLLASGELPSLSLDAVARHFGVSRPSPHRALEDARASYEVARRLVARMNAGRRLGQLAGDERDIATALLERLELGRARYGAWSVDDGRDYEGEALEELLDGLHYLTAALVRRRRPRHHVVREVRS